MKDDSFYLSHILDSINQIQLYIKCLDYEAFIENRLVQDAVIRQLEIIGEAAKNLSGALRSCSPEIPWRDLAGMRDKLIHHYFGIDIYAVWETATQDIEPLKIKIQKLL